MKKHRLLAGSGVRSAVPAARRFGRSALDAMLDRHRSVVIKPTGGSGGKGIRFVTALGDGRYRVRSGARAQVIRGRDALYRHLRGKAGGRRHLIQRKIPLATVDGRPFDVRVMVQRQRRGNGKSGGGNGSGWRVTAKLVRVAGPGYLITNTARSGGRVLPFSAALRRSNIRTGAGGLEGRINRLSLRAVRSLHAHCRALHTVGLDIGVDRSGRPWIIEANFTPSKSLFKRLKDQTLYRRILRYTR